MKETNTAFSKQNFKPFTQAFRLCPLCFLFTGDGLNASPWKPACPRS